MTRRFTTFQERIRIEELSKQGVYIADIAATLGKSYSAVLRELKLCETGKYTADAAQKIRDIKRVQTREKMSRSHMGMTSSKNSTKQINALERIESLEMQVEILHETIRRLEHDFKNKKL